MSDCSRCRTSVAPLPDRCLLFLVPPQGHGVEPLVARLGRLGEVAETAIEGVVALRLEGGRVAASAEELEGLLTPDELEESRALLIEDGGAPSPTDLMRAEPLSGWIGRMRGRYVAALIAEGRLTCHFQPIVHGRDPATVFAHECLLRGRAEDGRLIPPTAIYRDARRAGLLFVLDRAARLTAIREAVAHGLGGRLFINFNPTSIYDPAACLRSTVAAIAEAGLPAGRVTFEVVESERADPEFLARIVRYYREAGFRVALDDLGAGYSTLNLLVALRPDFVKLDRELISGVDRDPYRACIAARLVQMALDLGIETIAEGVETEGELAWLQDRGVDFIQGFLIARPGLPPFELAPPRAADDPSTPFPLGLAE